MAEWTSCCLEPIVIMSLGHPILGRKCQLGEQTVSASLQHQQNKKGTRSVQCSSIQTDYINLIFTQLAM